MVLRDHGGDGCGRGCVYYIFVMLVVRKFVVLTGDDRFGGVYGNGGDSVVLVVMIVLMVVVALMLAVVLCGTSVGKDFKMMAMECRYMIVVVVEWLTFCGDNGCRYLEN